MFKRKRIKNQLKKSVTGKNKQFFKRKIVITDFFSLKKNKIPIKLKKFIH